MCSFIHKKGPQNPVICSFVTTYVKYLSFCIPTLLLLKKAWEVSLPIFFLPLFCGINFLCNLYNNMKKQQFDQVFKVVGSQC